MSSPQQILNDQYLQTFERLQITDSDWWAKVGEFQGDTDKVLEWIASLEANFDTKVEVATVAADTKVEVATVVADTKVEVATVAADTAVKTVKPKRALSAYIYFGKVMRAKLKADSPGMKQSEIMKTLGSLWKSASEDDKIPYNKLAVEDKSRYNKEMETYVPSDSEKEKKTKKTKRTTCSKQCIARKWNSKKGELTGNKQCRAHCVTEEDAYCQKCQTHADNYDGKVGPALWKFCLDHGITRKDTLPSGSKPGLWFGRIDDYETDAVGNKFDYPAASVLDSDNKRIVVLAFPNNPNHEMVGKFHLGEQSILSPSTTLKDSWPKKRHVIGRKQKETKKTQKKTSKVQIEDVVKSIFAQEDSVEVLDTEVDLDDEDFSPEPTIHGTNQSIIVCAWDGHNYNVNHSTMEISNDENDMIYGDWVMKDPADKPESLDEIKKWLQTYGRPDDTTEDAVVGDGSEDSEDLE